jgi:hypothetical protein
MDKSLEKVLQDAGASGFTAEDIAAEFGRSRRQAERWLRPLRDSRALEQTAHGRYRIRAAGEPMRPILTNTGEQVWRLLVNAGVDAYLSGFDLIANRSHHHLMAFPHLVVAERGGAEDLAADIDAAGLVPVVGYDLPAVADVDRIVIVREARGRTVPIYQIRQHLAPPEVAWIDLYREVRRGVVALEPDELGRILVNLLREPGFKERFELIARRHYAAELLPLGHPSTNKGLSGQIARALAE